MTGIDVEDNAVVNNILEVMYEVVAAPHTNQEKLVLHQKANGHSWWRRCGCKAEQSFLGFIPTNRIRVFKGGEIQQL